MEIASKIWFDGQIEIIENLSIPLLSHSLHYGSAIFEGMRFYDTHKGPAIFRLKEHVERFFHSAKAIHFEPPYSQQELTNAIFQTIQKNNFSNGYIRLIGFFGGGDMELHPTNASLHVAVILWPWNPRMGNTNIKMKISSFVRTPPKSTVITAKLSGHYANSILARQEARHLGFQEALLLDSENCVAEASGANFFCVKDGMLRTPPPENIFPGITRESILNIAQDLEIPVKIEKIHVGELNVLDEAFLSGTAMELIAIASIDQMQMKNANGPLSSLLKNRYADIVRGRVPSYYKWLTFVQI